MNRLMEASLKNAGWNVKHYPFEIGSRGYLSDTVFIMLKALILSSAERQKLRGRLENTALLCSYILYVNRNQSVWAPRPLMLTYLLGS